MFTFGIAGGGHGPVRVAEPLQLDGDGRGLFGSPGSGGRGHGPPLGSRRRLGGGPGTSPRLSLLAHQHQSVPKGQTMDQNYWPSIIQIQATGHQSIKFKLLAINQSTQCSEPVGFVTIPRNTVRDPKQ
jgi:hypothetical protein